MRTAEERLDLYVKIVVSFIVVVPLVLTLAAIVLLWNSYVFPKDILLMVIFYTIAVMGTTVGYHRMLTHDGFKAPGWLRGLILICGCTAFEGAPAQWTATHIKHHAHSDEEDDPHSPLQGFWHAHLGWLFQGKNYVPVAVYAPNLLEDRVVMWVEKTAYLWAGLSLLLPLLIGGWTGFVWGAGVRIFLNTHVTYSVNSICHTFGRRAFETTDESRNHWVVGLLAFGEGWHNNHHAFPKNAFHGMRWWQIDASGLVISLLEKLGLVWDVQRVTDEAVQQLQSKTLRSRDTLLSLQLQVNEAALRAEQELTSFLQASIQQSLAGNEAERIQQACTQALDRLWQIRSYLRRTGRVKRAALVSYMGEVQALLQKARSMSPALMKS